MQLSNCFFFTFLNFILSSVAPLTLLKENINLLSVFLTINLAQMGCMS